MSAAALLDQERLAHLQAVIAQDVAAGRYFGAVITVARGGHIGLHAAIGYAASTLDSRTESYANVAQITGPMRPAPPVTMTTLP